MYKRKLSRRSRLQINLLVLVLTLSTIYATLSAFDENESNASNTAYVSRSGYVWAPFGEGIPGSSRALREMHIQE